jgi:hypothetical protein
MACPAQPCAVGVDGRLYTAYIKASLLLRMLAEWSFLVSRLQHSYCDDAGSLPKVCCKPSPSSAMQTATRKCPITPRTHKTVTSSACRCYKCCKLACRTSTTCGPPSPCLHQSSAARHRMLCYTNLADSYIYEAHLALYSSREQCCALPMQSLYRRWRLPRENRLSTQVVY